MEEFTVYIIPKKIGEYCDNLFLTKDSYQSKDRTQAALLIKGKKFLLHNKSRGGCDFKSYELFYWGIVELARHSDFPEELTKDSIPTELTDLIKQKNLELYIVDGGGEKKPVPLQ